MLYLTLRNSLARPARSILTILAVAAILAEILILEGFLAGSYAQLRQTVLHRGGDVIVSQAGVSNFLATRSVLPQQARAEVEAVKGVKASHPLTSLAVIYEKNGRTTPIIVLVYDDAGGPIDIISGREPSGPREIVIDRALAQRYGIGVGDILTLADFDFTISGVSANTAALFTPLAFMNYDSLIDFYFESDVASDIATFPLISFLSVDVENGADPAEVARRIAKQVPSAGAILPHEMASNDVEMGRELLGPILNLLLGISYVIGALAIGMFMFAAVRAQRKSFGVLRALGFNTRHLVTGVLAEAVTTSVLAIPLGILMAVGLAALIEAYAPVYLVLATEPAALWRTGLIAIVLAIVGALAPLQTLRRLDPATAFRG
ncbi:MAG: ABC transporter permease [Alphaproteobacteria bacterium]|nr:ABC transporter permease [Alphaproteobacteria bacterium]